ncbi:bifunctional biotin--[acetyl-CoA-carboxylase] ligase/biotin operon repressor BirA [Catenovulum sp. 2E275]|uniref:bifunctional biotin--[acetyl-CoA-carboxylase] ligase/biotin operon repressor BirA n=1 Tax=Catenovulum sp. 2E275 TaxID=2980497 RepID=UPI0021CE182A|nr:bifunctional biotin--[acetyl-CoA-carboxylase] ligase/biotin operon repressor BirA [Catenovulum sp. 2E275]MCU4677170.1 bifunctional biotin--[acetyl-CoA-carboxylase] ligase/biotin operon repressor BirA [Catenovulum sp. 2E275]
MNIELLLEALGQDGFHSGEVLAKQFNMSRAAISKWINKLRNAGYDIHSVPGKGYCFANYVQPFDQPLIRAKLADKLHLILSRETDSTNEDVKQCFKQTEFERILATTEKQTAGRGRRGRVWHSPYAQNIYFSLGLKLDLAISELSGLSLVVGLAIADLLKSKGVPIQLKWPNDIYLEGKKLGGILVELEGAFEPPCNVIIGTGLNVNMPQQAQAIDQAWQSLAEYTGKVINRTELLLELVDQLQLYLTQFCQNGMAEFVEKWPTYDLYHYQKVQLISGEQVTRGINLGINEQGGLRLLTDSGEVELNGGELSLRPE